MKAQAQLVTPRIFFPYWVLCTHSDVHLDIVSNDEQLPVGGIPKVRLQQTRGFNRTRIEKSNFMFGGIPKVRRQQTKGFDRTRIVKSNLVR